MAELNVGNNFKQSYESYLSYPTRLIYRTTYPSELQNYKDRLDQTSDTLCVQDEKRVDVGFRDWVPANSKGSNLNTNDPHVLKRADGDMVLIASNLKSKSEIKKWLGDNPTPGPGSQQQQTATPTVTKPDPKCRFIFVWALHSKAHLKITKELLLQILCYHQVMPSHLDFLSIFGQQDDARELRFSGFRYQIFLELPQGRPVLATQQRTLCSTQIATQEGDPLPSTPCAQPAKQQTQAINPSGPTGQTPITPLVSINPDGPCVSELGRSGRCFQMSYNLKTVVNAAEFKKSPPSPEEQEWSIRQAAFHHQFDVETGVTLWITTSGHDNIQKRVQELTGPRGRPEDHSFSTVAQCFKSSLAVHLLFCHWSTSNWRQYIRWLEDRVQYMTEMAVYGSRQPDSNRQQYKPEDLQTVQDFRDKVNEVIMVVKANSDVMASVRSFYKDLKTNAAFPLRDTCAADIESFAAQINNMIGDIKLQLARAKLLEQITADRKELIVQHLQSQASEQMAFLADLAQREAVAMRVITVVTTFFLPATFVSTFFSTDIVKFQNPNGGPPTDGTYSHTAMVRWVEVTVPLFAITACVAFGWYWFANRTRKSWSRDYWHKIAEQFARHSQSRKKPDDKV